MQSGKSKNIPEPVIYETSLNHQKRTGTFWLFILFGLGGFWASTAPIDGAALAPGKVIVKSYSKTVQHLEGGIINEIFVEDGARVEEGEPILDLDNTQSLARLEIENSRYVALKALEGRLIAERDDSLDLSYNDELLSKGPRSRDETNAQIEIFKARKSSKQGSIDVLQQRIEQLNSQKVGLLSLKESKELLAISYQEELLDVEQLLTQGFADKNRVRELQRAVAGLNGEVAELAANIAAADVQVGESQLQILQLEKDFHNEVVTQLAQVQTSLSNSVEQIIALEDVVSRTVVRAPEAGLVNGLQVHTIGGVIGPGMRIVDIVPENDDLVVWQLIEKFFVDNYD